jgi:NAD dependent epimerase/dehydratase
MKRALVTGAGGFVGSHLVEALVRDGWQVRAFLRYTSKSSRGWLEDLPPDVQNDIEFVHGDIRDADSVTRAACACRRIYHLAALVGIPYSYETPSAYVQTNIVGTLNVLTAARDLGDTLERVLHTSTSECYGTAMSVPISESHPLQAQSPYAASKIAADKLAESFHRSYGLRVATIRPFNIFGPRQTMRAVVPTIVSQCLGGDVVKIGNLDATRDFTFVADMVRGFMAIADEPAAEGRVLNVGSGKEYSVHEVYKKVCQIVGRCPKLETDAARVRPASSEVERLVADASLLSRLTGWTPQYSFDEGLRKTVAWIESNLTKFRLAEYHV